MATSNICRPSLSRMAAHMARPTCCALSLPRTNGLKYGHEHAIYLRHLTPLSYLSAHMERTSCCSLSLLRTTRLHIDLGHLGAIAFLASSGSNLSTRTRGVQA